jgi:HlyD family secretion protein
MRIVSLLLLVTLWSCKGQKQESVFPIRKDLTQAVYASGKIFPKDNYKLFAKLPGYVQVIHVRVGDTVAAGQALITIRSEVSELNVAAAKNQYALASSNASDDGPILPSLRAEVNATKSKRASDSVNVARFTALLATNATAVNTLDQAKVTFENSKAQHARAEGNYHATRLRLQTEAQNAKLQMDAQTSNRNEYIIAAVSSGRVYDIIPKVGDFVNSNKAIMELGNSTSFQVELNIDETDIALIKPGQNIVYEIDAYEGKTFNGTVDHIYPRISAGDKTALVIGTLNQGNERWYSGMSLEANIVIDTKKNIMVIPREFLSAENTVKVKGKDEAVKVTTGLKDLRYVEIISGINEQDLLIK